jgi:hypothetical protein
VPTTKHVRGTGPNRIQAPLGIRPIADDVTQTDDHVGAALGLLQGQQGFPIGVQVTEKSQFASSGYHSFQFCYRFSYGLDSLGVLTSFLILDSQFL